MTNSALTLETYSKCNQFLPLYSQRQHCFSHGIHHTPVIHPAFPLSLKSLYSSSSDPLKTLNRSRHILHRSHLPSLTEILSLRTCDSCPPPLQHTDHYSSDFTFIVISSIPVPPLYLGFFGDTKCILAFGCLEFPFSWCNSWVDICKAWSVISFRS